MQLLFALGAVYTITAALKTGGKMKQEFYMHNFSVIHRYSIMHHIKDMKKCRVSGHQMGYIIHIHKHPGASQEDIAAFFKLNKGTVAKGIKKLLDEGYLIRKQNENDRRAYELYLTESGEELFAESERSLQDVNDIFNKGLTDEEQELFRQLLNKVTQNVLEAAGEEKEALMRPGPPPGTADCCCSDDSDFAPQINCKDEI